MVFWTVVGVVLAALLGWAWAYDRRGRGLSVTRRNGPAETAYAEGHLRAQVDRSGPEGGAGFL